MQIITTLQHSYNQGTNLCLGSYCTYSPDPLGRQPEETAGTAHHSKKEKQAQMKTKTEMTGNTTLRWKKEK